MRVAIPGGPSDWRRRVTLCLGVLALFAPAAPGGRPLTAQAVPPDFSWARVELGGVGDPGSGLLGAWDPARGVFLQVATPWGGGELSSRLEATRQAGRPPGQGPLDEIRAVLGWAKPWRIAAPLALRLGGELGIDYFRLPRPVNPGETEVDAGVLAEVTLILSDDWGMTVGARRRWTFTDPVLRRDVVSLGLARTLGLPAPARAVLEGEVAPDQRVGRLEGFADPPRWSTSVEDVPGWAPVSVDGVTVSLAPPGVPAAAASRVAVRLDGWTIPLDILGVTSLDRLPVEPASVGRMEARAAGAGVPPGFDGVLDLASRPLPVGVSGRVATHVANATGDGGPRALVVGEGPNVESLEWGWAALGGWSAADASVRVEGGHHRRWVSELPVFGRNFDVADSDVRWPWVDVLRGRIAASASRGGFVHEASAGGSRVDDFFLLPGAPREVPAVTRLASGWARGRGTVADWAVTYGVGHTVNRLLVTQNRPGWSLDWREATSSARAGVRRGMGGLELSLERRRVESDAPLRDPLDGIATLEGDVAMRSRRGLDLELAGRLLRADGSWGGGGWATLARRRAGSTTTARLGAESTPPAVRGGPWLAASRGLDVLERWGVGYEGPDDSLPSARRWVLEAWHRRDRERGYVEVGGRVDRVAGSWLAQAPVGERAGVPMPVGPVTLVPDARGVLGFLGVRYGWAWGTVSLTGSHDLRAPLDGDEALRSAHASLPRYRSVHGLRWRPRRDMALNARLEARSGARFADWRDAGPLFSGSLPGGAVLDLGAEKALLGGRAQLEVVVRDVFDRELATHPLAGTPGLTLEVLGRLRVGAQAPGDASSASRLR